MRFRAVLSWLLIAALLPVPPAASVRPHASLTSPFLATETLAPRSTAARFPSGFFKIGRAHIVIQALRNVIETESVHAGASYAESFRSYDYAHLQLLGAMDVLVGKNKGLVIPKTSVVHRMGITDHSTVSRNVFSMPSPELKEEFTRIQERLKELLFQVVKAEEGNAAGPIAYQDLMNNLAFLDPDAFHVTFANLYTGPKKGYFHSQLQRWRELRRTLEISMFRRFLVFLFKGNTAILTSGSPCLVLLVEPGTVFNERRFKTFLTEHGARLRERYQLPHVSLLYFKGTPDGQGGFVVPAHHLRRIVKAQQLLERELAEKQEKPDEWTVKSLDVSESNQFGDVGKITPYPLLSQSKYEEKTERGIRLLARWWLHKRLPEQAEFGAVLGLFRHIHLRDIRALFVAVGSGAISARSVIELLSHSKKIRVTTQVNGPETHLTLEGQFSHPSIFISISRTLDLYPGKVYEIRKGEAIHIVLRDISPSQAGLLAAALRKIPDIRRRHHEWRSVTYLTHFLMRRWEGLRRVPVHLDFADDTGQINESRRSILLQALNDLDPHNTLEKFTLQVMEGKTIIEMLVEVPEGLASRVQGQLEIAMGRPTPVLRLSERAYTLLLNHMGFADEPSFAREWARTIYETSPFQKNHFRAWVEGLPLYYYTNADVFQYAYSAARAAYPSLSTDEEAELTMNFAWLSGIAPASAHVESTNWESAISVPLPQQRVHVLRDAGTPVERDLYFEIVDSAQMKSGGGVYFLDNEGSSHRPSYRVQIQARVLHEGPDELEKYMREVYYKTRLRTLGYSQAAVDQFWRDAVRSPDALHYSRDQNPTSPGVLMGDQPGHVSSDPSLRRSA